MKLAIVILNWNGRKLLESFLPSVTSFSKEATVYVADNASTDDSLPFVKENYPEVKLVINKENGGYAKGYNDALHHIDADVYCLLNSDIEVSENWLVPIIETFNSDPDIVAIQPKLIDYKDKTKFEYAGAGGGLIDKYGYPYCRGRLFNTIETDTGQYNDTCPIFWASGACLFIKSETYHEHQGFDSDFFAHQEEIDLCWRIQNTGKKIYYVGTSEVYHVGGATLNALSP
ncbi:MAG: glycosyltransferase family 2 protein, partial [Flavobacteriaceae bacterium]|nr:glycosyltransferase family 2 protein [Flavobacteriaceae bacterium]